MQIKILMEYTHPNNNAVTFVPIMLPINSTKLFNRQIADQFNTQKSRVINCSVKLLSQTGFYAINRAAKCINKFEKRWQTLSESQLTTLIKLALRSSNTLDIDRFCYALNNATEKQIKNAKIIVLPVKKVNADKAILGLSIPKQGEN